MRNLRIHIAGIAVALSIVAPFGMRACEPVETNALPTGQVTKRNLGEKVPGAGRRVEICVKAESDQKRPEKGPGAGKWKKGQEYCHGNFKEDSTKGCTKGKYWPGCYGKEN